MSPVLDVLDEGECRRLLRSQTFGRVAVSVGALPAIFPVDFRLVDNRVVFRAAAGTRLAAATDEAVVAFEVDDHDPWSHEGWSVMVVGRARRGADDARVAWDRSWAPGDRHHVVMVSIESISGRRLRRGALA